MMNYGAVRVFALRDWGKSQETCWVNWYLCKDLKPGTSKYKAGVLCCLVGLNKISLYSLNNFLTLQETERKTKENSGRKHKKESPKEGRAEAEINERDAEEIRE